MKQFGLGRGRGGRARRRSVAALGSAAIVASGAAVVVVGGAGVAAADDLTVTTCADSGPGSLREAIATAVGSAGPDTITITATCTASSPVAVGSVMDVSGGGPLSVVGPGADAFVLDGGGTAQLLAVHLATGSFSISGVTLHNGFDALYGAAISSVTTGPLSVSGVVFSGNRSTRSGGAALQVGYASAVTISDSSFIGNDARGSGGALYMRYLTGEVTISTSTFADNLGSDGGAIRIYSSPGDLAIYNSTMTGNTASYTGGAVSTQFYGSVSVVFSTVTDNTAGTAGGGLFVDANAAELVLSGSIVAGNGAGDSGTDEIESQVGATEAHNLIEGPVSGFTPDATDVVGLDPRLAPLADNGGPTLTRALGAGSPAIDVGPVAFSFPGDTSDQRGAPFLRISGGRSDVGAFEVQPIPEPEPSGSEPTFTG